MKFKLKKTICQDEKEVVISIQDLDYMNKQLKKDEQISGFIFALEKIE